MGGIGKQDGLPVILVEINGYDDLNGCEKKVSDHLLIDGLWTI